MLKPTLMFIVAMAVGGAIGADDGLSDFSNDLFTDLGPLLALFGESMTRQYLSESTSFLDYFIFAMCPIGIITTVVSAIRLCGHSSLRAFVGRSQEGNGVVEAELCTSTSRDVCELFSRGGIARVLGRPTILELVQVEEKHPNHTAGLHLSRHFFTMDEAAIPWTRVKDSHNGSLGSSASNPPNLSLNVGIVKQDDWKFMAVAILGFILQAGILALAGVGGWVFQWNLAGTGNAASRNYAPIMFIIGTAILCGGLWSCAALIGESTREIRYKRESGPEQSSQLIWLQPHQVIGDQSFDPFAYLDKDMNITVWTASKKEAQIRKHKMYQVSTLFGVVAVLIGYVMQFIGLRGMKAWVSLTQLGITITMSILRGLLRMQRLDSNGNDNKLADQPDLVEGYELEWLALEIAEPKSCSTTHNPSHKSNKDSASGINTERASQAFQPSGSQRSSETRSGREAGISMPPCRASIHSRSHAVSGHSQSPTNNQCSTSHQNQLVSLQHTVLVECSKHRAIQADQKRRLSLRERLSHLTGHIPATISLEDGEFTLWRDHFVKVRPKAKEVSTALGLAVNSLFRESDASDIDTHVLGFFDVVHCATCDHNDPVSVNMKAAKGPYGTTWAVDSAKIESLLGLIMWSLLSDERTSTRGDNESPFKTSWCDGIQTRRIISVDSDVDDVDRRSHAQTEADLWLGSNRLQVSQASTLPAESITFNLRDLWRNSQGDQWSALDPSDISKSDTSLVRFCGWTGVSTPFGASEIRAEHPVERTTTSSQHTNSRPIFQVQYTVAQGSLLDICAKELFYTLLLAMSDRMDIKCSVVKEMDGEVRLNSPAVDTLAKIFVGAGLGSDSEALPYIIPALRRYVYVDGLEGLFRTLLKSAQTYRNKSHWESAETLVRWACTDYIHLHSLSARKEHFFIRAFVAAGELYRSSLCQTGSVERREFGNIGFDWMNSKALGDFIRAHGSVLSNEIMNIWASYRNVKKVFRKDPNEDTTMISLEGCIRKNQREEALRHLCLKRPEPSIDQAPDPRLIVLVTGKNWLEVLTALLEMEGDPNARDERGRTAMSIAAEHNYDLCAATLMDYGASLQEPEPAEGEETPMVLAARNGHNAMLQYLIDSGRMHIDRPDGNNVTPLIEAINCGREETVHLLLAKGAKVRTDPDHNAFLAASRAGNVPIARLLLSNDPGCEREHESIVQNKKTHKNDPLWCAIQAGHRDFAKFMLRRGANINGQDDNDDTMLDLAAMSGLETAIDILVKNGAAVNGLDEQRNRPLHMALFYRKETAARLLVDLGASLDESNWLGQKAIHVAATYCSETMVQFLLDKGVSVNCESDNGRTPLSFAAEAGQEKVARLLLKKAADVDRPNSWDETPLIIAIQETHESVVKILLENRASMDCKTKNGKTPLAVAEDEVTMAQEARDIQRSSWGRSYDKDAKESILNILKDWNKKRGQ